MELERYTFKEITERVANTPFAILFKSIQKIKDKTFFYKGLSNEQAKKIIEIELMVGYKLPKDYKNMLKLFNGGLIGDLYFYPLNFEEENTLFYENFASNTRQHHNIALNELIIAQSKDLIITVGIDDHDFLFYKVYEKSTNKNFIVANEVSHIIYYEVNSHLNLDSSK